jgi:hypothetical protein
MLITENPNWMFLMLISIPVCFALANITCNMKFINKYVNL